VTTNHGHQSCFRNTVSRRAFLKTAMALGAIPACGSLGVALYEPHEVKVVQLEIQLRRLPIDFDGLRLVQLSDIHFGSYMTQQHLRKIVETANAQRPDLAVFTGDYVTQASHHSFADKRAEQAWPCAEVLRDIRAPLGRIAVLGNHDCATNPDIVAAAMRTNNIQVLRNRSIPLERNRKRLWLAGVDDVVEENARPELALKGVPHDECVLAVVHEPDFADEIRKHPVDFQISGHSHGGQIRFPVVGPLYLPEMAKKYPLGHYRIGEFQLYTNRGIGVIGLPLRFLCPPEITLFTLRSCPQVRLS
jgi:hypothetical protein